MRRVAPIALLAFATQALGAQVTGFVDLSASDIRYDLFQPSSALALSPTVRFDRGWTSLTARGTLLRFASGHRDLHGSLLGTTFTPAFGHFRLEVGGDLGASRYLTLPAFSHVFGAVDLHYLLPRSGAWIGGTGGNTSFGGRSGTAGSFGFGLWASTPWATVSITGAHSAIGDTSYTDLEGASRVTRGRVEFEGLLGARVGSIGGGHGVYGEATLRLAVARGLGVVLGAGRYPTDPTRGTIAGRYVTLALRVGTPDHRPADPYREVLDRYRTFPSADAPVTAGIEIGPETGAGRILRVRAEGAGRVEVMGDFTDWQVTPLASVGQGLWEVVIPISPGPHRLEIRMDGGAWGAPAGTTRVPDEFGGETGLIVVP